MGRGHGGDSLIWKAKLLQWGCGKCEKFEGFPPKGYVVL